MSPKTINYLCFLLILFLFRSTTPDAQNKEKKEKLSLMTLLKRKTINVFYSKSIAIFVNLNFST
jgi:nitric oxide reductase large subunit